MMTVNIMELDAKLIFHQCNNRKIQSERKVHCNRKAHDTPLSVSYSFLAE